MSINHFLSTAFGIAGSEKYTLGPPIFFSYFQKKHSKWLTNFNKNGDKKVQKKNSSNKPFLSMYKKSLRLKSQ